MNATQKTICALGFLNMGLGAFKQNLLLAAVGAAMILGTLVWIRLTPPPLE